MGCLRKMGNLGNLGNLGVLGKGLCLSKRVMCVSP